MKRLLSIIVFASFLSSLVSGGILDATGSTVTQPQPKQKPVVKVAAVIKPAPTPAKPTFNPADPSTWPSCPAGDIVRADNGQCAAPAVAPAPVSQPQAVITSTVAPANAVTTAPEGSGSLQAWLYTLRMCESGGNYQEDTGNGFYGAYQFTLSTWASLGTGYSNPVDAPPAVQDAAIVANTNRSSGGLATQNPGCYAKEGLSAFPPS